MIFLYATVLLAPMPSTLQGKAQEQTGKLHFDLEINVDSLQAGLFQERPQRPARDHRV
jgi:hypothetical protein